MSRRNVRRGALANWHLQYGPNMTPMVDVVMVILIFFMASVAILGPEWFLRSSLPVAKKIVVPAGTKMPKTEDRFEFTLTRSGDSPTVVSGAGLENATLNALLARLENLATLSPAEDIAVVLRPSPTVPYQDLVRVHETCQKIGIVKVGMAD